MPSEVFEFKPEDYPIMHRFFLPYIVQPAGEWEHTYEEQKWKVKIQPQIVPPLMEIVTGIKFTRENPARIEGPQEIFIGITKMEAYELTPPSHFKPRLGADNHIRKLITDLLNDLQYRYLVLSGKYWWNEISADHFVNMESVSQRLRSNSVSWGGSKRQFIDWRRDGEILTDFANHLRKNVRLPVEEIFLTDAKRHYLTGEYHLMHVEVATALEAVAERAYRSISRVYEQRMFKEGRLAGKIAHLLYLYCKWSESDIEKVVNAIESRNQVIHDRKRNFSPDVSYSSLEVSIRAVHDIMAWTDKNQRT